MALKARLLWAALLCIGLLSLLVTAGCSKDSADKAPANLPTHQQDIGATKRPMKGGSMPGQGPPGKGG